jgi:hypothetical protein
MANQHPAIPCLKAAREVLLAANDHITDGHWHLRDAAQKCWSASEILAGRIGDTPDQTQRLLWASLKIDRAMFCASLYPVQNPLVEDAIGFMEGALEWIESPSMAQAAS